MTLFNRTAAIKSHYIRRFSLCDSVPNQRKQKMVIKSKNKIEFQSNTKFNKAPEVFKFVLSAVTAACIAAPTLAGELLVYSSTDADNLKYYMEEFQKDNPDIKVNVVRESTGTMAAKMMAEKDNPQADFLFEMAATVALSMESQGMFHEYTPVGMDKIDPRYVDTKEPVTWVGNYGWAGCICWNRIEAEKLGLPKPKSWAELVNPIYKGHISMPNPASSGTGFLDVSSWMQIMGEDKAWEYMDALHENVGIYTHSGSKPCKQAGAGEFPIGISWPGRAIKIIKAGAPIDMIIPEEGIGWEMQVVAIMKGTDNLPDAKRLMDWTLARGMELFGERQSIIADISKVKKDPELPDFYDEVVAKLINNDFVWAAKNKTEIVGEWKKRYDGKSEPKK
jgi:iron(III) transport system substrate-binding protein